MMPPAGPTTPSGDMNCGIKRHNLEKRPAELLLVLDRSGSMLEPVTDPATGMGVEKWSATVGALDAVLQATQAQVSWGLKLYPVGGDQCDVADAPEVPVAAANHAAVLASINGMPAMRDGGSTPTQAAVRKATAVLPEHPLAQQPLPAGGHRRRAQLRPRRRRWRRPAAPIAPARWRRWPTP